MSGERRETQAPTYRLMVAASFRDPQGIKQRYRATTGLKTFVTAARFCGVFDELRAFLRPQSHHNQLLTLEQRRCIHRERFAHVMAFMAA
jgi:putative transposase